MEPSAETARSSAEAGGPADADPPPQEATAPSFAERGLADAVVGALAGGASDGEVLGALVDGGCRADGARAILLAARAPRAPRPDAHDPAAPNSELADRHARRILYGFLWATGGVVVTLVSYDAAPSGGRYAVAYGAILYGVIAMMAGAVGWAKHR